MALPLPAAPPKPRPRVRVTAGTPQFLLGLLAVLVCLGGLSMFGLGQSLSEARGRDQLRRHGVLARGQVLRTWSRSKTYHGTRGTTTSRALYVEYRYAAGGRTLTAVRSVSQERYDVLRGASETPVVYLPDDPATSQPAPPEALPSPLWYWVLAAASGATGLFFCFPFLYFAVALLRHYWRARSHGISSPFVEIVNE